MLQKATRCNRTVTEYFHYLSCIDFLLTCSLWPGFPHLHFRPATHATRLPKSFSGRLKSRSHSKLNWKVGSPGSEKGVMSQQAVNASVKQTIKGVREKEWVTEVLDTVNILRFAGFAPDKHRGAQSLTHLPTHPYAHRWIHTLLAKEIKKGEIGEALKVWFWNTCIFPV